MFESLGERLQNAIDKIKGYGKITEDNISDVVREIRLALLEADVNYKVVKEFVNNVKEKAGVKGKMLFMPIRIAASGIMHGPELADTLYLIGKEEILNRLK